MIRITTTVYNKEDGEVIKCNIIQASNNLAENCAKMIGIEELNLTEQNRLFTKELENFKEILEVDFMWINDKEIK